MQAIVMMNLRAVVRDKRGQGTVEAAFLLPIAFIVVLLLVQPGILLYDRVVMQGTAAEACRLLATQSTTSEDTISQCEAYVRRRLGSVPQQDCFHVHDSGCTWDIRFEGGESSQTVKVTIATEAKPLPLFDGMSTLLGLVNEHGNFVVTVSVTQQTQPMWVKSSPAGYDPPSWIGAWIDET